MNRERTNTMFKTKHFAPLDSSYRLIRRVGIGVVGTLVCIAGIIMLVTPGPALVVLPAGLAILSLEFTFARRWLKVLRQKISKMTQKKRLQNN